MEEDIKILEKAIKVLTGNDTGIKMDFECTAQAIKNVLHALKNEKTVHISKLKYLIDSNLEKTENGNYIFASNDCQTIVRHLKRIVNNEDYDVTCLHCETDTPLYCEKCYQELISKNAELQIEIEKIKEKHKITCELNVGLLENIKDFIPKQAIRDKIEEIQNEFKERTQDNDSFYYDYSNEYAHIEEVLKELLGDE